MSFLRNIFRSNSPKIECPRCLGKGFVNMEDIKRLKREFKWKPGSCAYCNGTGKVKSETIKKIPVDTSYLTTDQPAKEAIKLLRGDKDALERAKQFDVELDSIIAEIKNFYFKEGWDISKIAKYYFEKFPNAFAEEYHRDEMMEYIKGVVQGSNKNNR